MKYWLYLCLLICSFSLCFATPRPVFATPAVQEQVTLQIRNESEQTVCYVYISPITATTWGEDWLGNDTLPPGQSYPFILAPDDYDVRLEDCDGNVLLDKRRLTIDRDQTLPLTQSTVSDAVCDTYNQQGIQAYSRSQYTPALVAFQSALSCYRKVGDRSGEGTTLNNIGEVYRVQGRYGEALERLEQALAIRREVGDRVGESATLNGIGLVYYLQGRYGEALNRYEQALAIRREVGDLLGEGQTLNNIGEVYRVQGLYGKALNWYEQALIIKREVGNRAGEGTTLNNIAAVYYNQGLYGEALNRYEQALALRREVGDLLGEGTTLNNIGEVYHAQGRYGEALERFMQALAIVQEVGDRTGEGTILNNIATVYDDQGLYEQALDRFKQALAIHREVGDRAGEGTTLNNIAMVYGGQGLYEQALDWCEQALDIRHEVGDRTGEGQTLNNIAVIYYNQGRYGEALEHYEQALIILREVGDRTGEGKTLSNIAAMYYNQGRYGEALEHYEQALIIFEMVRAEAGSEVGRTRFIDQYISAYNQAILVSRRLGNEQLVFLLTERGRARAFVDTLATGEVQLEDNVAAALLVKEQALYAERQELQDALARSRALVPPAPQEVAALEAELAAVEEDSVKVQADIAARSDQLAALIPGRSMVLKLAEVQALLDEETTLLSYWMLGEEGTLALVITADSFAVVELPGATSESVLNALAGLYDWMNREHPHPRALRQLHAWLVAPLAEYLRTPHVTIVPHQQLHYVPFTGLSDGDSYFGDQFTLSVLPSATTLQYLQEGAQIANAADYKNALIFGNPATTLLPPLAHAAGEAQAIGSLLGTAIYTTTAATEAELWHSAEGIGVLHLAAHGSYSETSPLHSAIYLAPDEDYADEYDGRLEAQEIFALPLQGTQLVTLSACETSIGELSRGDELVGLTRAFFFAGTPTVISSLWNVDDAATETLMVAFYRHWLEEGMSKAAALQAAQADVRAHPRWVSPFYWAGFVLNGDPGTAS